MAEDFDTRAIYFHIAIFSDYTILKPKTINLD